MPVYNCELYIKEAVESILNQTFIDFEFLIIDDASTDQTLSIIKNYKDPRIKLIEKPINTGLTNSLNMGLSIAKGKYIARMDGDDISLPERFAKQVAFLDNNTDYVLCGSIYSILVTNEIINLPENNDVIKLSLLETCCIAHPSVMMRKLILDEYAIEYDLSKETAEDYDMWVRLASKGNFHNLQEVLLKYRVHSTQISQKKSIQQKKVSLDAKLDLLNYLNILLEEREVLRKIIKGNVRVDFVEIEMFERIKIKLNESNSVCFFEPIGFQLYLSYLERRLLIMFFSKKDRYSPLDFLRYLKIKNKFKLKFTIIDEFKLLVKSFILYKN